MTTVSLRRIDSVDELLALGHPVLTYDIGTGFAPPAYAWGDLDTGGAVVVERRSDRGVPGLAAIGAGPGIRRLVADPAVRDLVNARGLTHLSVPRGLFEQVEDLYAWGGGGEWDWMWTTQSPSAPLPHESAVETVGPRTAARLTAFLGRASPRTHGEPFARPHQLWVVVREEAALVACGSWDRAASGVPVLTGIAVDPDRRGEGYGAAVTAYLTRAAVTRFGACTLGMFADNVTARRLYHRLGYRTGARWQTRWIVGS
jgi:ribosomal protein S18 acetylase RimI-like enzyme